MDTRQVLAKITDRTRAVFLTHVQGFNGLTDELIDKLAERNIPLIEDVCESHGATHNGRKAGSVGYISNFSYYYAHHMSTIEGGMVCTNDPLAYQQLRMMRAHGMVREMSDLDGRRTIIESHPDLNPDFIFAFPAYNFRNTEIGGILGRKQLRRLDENVRLRTANQSRFLRLIDSSRYRTDFQVDGSSNYAFNLVLKHPDEDLMQRLMARLRAEGVEFRRGSAGGGNQLRQPYLRGIAPTAIHNQFPQTDHVHFFGMYIGNFPDLGKGEIEEICAIINSA
jgi:CDP-6-deoxy-D-xylo-4-hexulose-3-dehydrase